MALKRNNMKEEIIITKEELNEILEYQIETIIRRETTYKFEIIDCRDRLVIYTNS